MKRMNKKSTTTGGGRSAVKTTRPRTGRRRHGAICNSPPVAEAGGIFPRAEDVKRIVTNDSLNLSKAHQSASFLEAAAISCERSRVREKRRITSSSIGLQKPSRSSCERQTWRYQEVVIQAGFLGCAPDYSPPVRNPLFTEYGGCKSPAGSRYQGTCNSPLNSYLWMPWRRPVPYIKKASVGVTMMTKIPLQRPSSVTSQCKKKFGPEVNLLYDYGEYRLC